MDQTLLNLTQSSPLLEQTLRIMHLLDQVALRRDRVAAEILKPYRLTLPQWRLLLHLAFADTASMNELAESLATDRTSLTRTVDKLVASQFVARSSPSHDRRVTMLTLTPAGRRLCATTLPHIADHGEWLLADIDETQLRRTTQVLEEMLARLIGHRVGVRRVSDIFQKQIAPR